MGGSCLLLGEASSTDVSIGAADITSTVNGALTVATDKLSQLGGDVTLKDRKSTVSGKSVHLGGGRAT